MSIGTLTKATLDDLSQIEGKAELVAGRIIDIMPTGHSASLIGFAIAIAINDYRKSVGRGFAYPDNIGFAVPELSSGRETFSPDASYYDGPPPAKERGFVRDKPTFAVEVRSEHDYGPAAERDMAEKRADYFEAGTKVVWDVDPEANVIHVYLATQPDQPTTFGKGEEANAEPALPGWRVKVDEMFESV